WLNRQMEDLVEEEKVVGHAQGEVGRQAGELDHKCGLIYELPLLPAETSRYGRVE
ncbi:hypothetical protein L0F63_003294, partial [Massospora cicadina]